MAGERNISIYQGDTYVHNVTMQDSSGDPIDISSRSYTGQIRKSPGASSVAATFTTAITNGAAGEVQFVLSANVTSNIAAGVYYYDFQETNGSIILTLMAGTATVVPQVTI